MDGGVILDKGQVGTEGFVKKKPMLDGLHAAICKTVMNGPSSCKDVNATIDAIFEESIHL